MQGAGWALPVHDFDNKALACFYVDGELMHQYCFIDPRLGGPNCVTRLCVMLGMMIVEFLISPTRPSSNRVGMYFKAVIRMIICQPTTFFSTSLLPCGPLLPNS